MSKGTYFPAPTGGSLSKCRKGVHTEWEPQLTGNKPLLPGLLQIFNALKVTHFRDCLEFSWTLKLNSSVLIQVQQPEVTPASEVWYNRTHISTYKRVSRNKVKQAAGNKRIPLSKASFFHAQFCIYSYNLLQDASQWNSAIVPAPTASAIHVTAKTLRGEIKESNVNEKMVQTCS